MKLNKSIYFLFLGTTLAISSVSCSDYLDTEPITDRAVELSDTPYKTASEAEDLMNTIYNDLGNEYWQLDYFLMAMLKQMLLTKEVIILKMHNRQNTEFKHKQ